MAAKNWAMCPKCGKTVEEIRKVLRAEAKKAYGQIPEKKYLNMVAEAGAHIVVEDTLREDYAIGIWNGEFSVSYRGHCDKCGFDKKFKTTEPIGI